MMVHSLFAAAFTPGARFASERGGTIEMSTQQIAVLKLPTGRVLASDPLTTSFENPGSPLARAAPTGEFPVEVALARFEGGDTRLACARVRFAEPRRAAVRWEVARFEGQEPPGPDRVVGYRVDAGMGSFFDAAARARVDETTRQAWLAAADDKETAAWTWHEAPLAGANVVMFSTGWGDGFYLSYWGFDAADQLVELVTDFEVLVGPISERIEVPLPLPRGRFRHPLLERHDVTMTVPLLSRRAAILGGRGSARIELSDGSAVQMTPKGLEREYTWDSASAGAKVVIHVLVGVEALQPV
jgi:hypothetical protein